MNSSKQRYSENRNSLLVKTKLILNENNIIPKKYASQNFVIDSEVLRRQIDYANIGEDEIILEIGTGIGNLTKMLLEVPNQIIAIEKDPEMVKIIKKRFPNKNNLRLTQGDVLKIKLPDFDKVISNIPYSISSPLTFMLLKRSFKKAVIMYQKEFANRLVALPGTSEYSRLSVSIDYYASVKLLEILPSTSFYPQPKVNSALVEITPKQPTFKVNEMMFFNVLRALFSHRGKTLKNAIVDSRLIRSKKKECRKILGDYLDDTTLKRRVFQLKPKEIAEITNTLEGEIA